MSTAGVARRAKAAAATSANTAGSVTAASLSYGLRPARVHRVAHALTTPSMEQLLQACSVRVRMKSSKKSRGGRGSKEHLPGAPAEAAGNMGEGEGPETAAEVVLSATDFERVRLFLSHLELCFAVQPLTDTASFSTVASNTCFMRFCSSS